MPGSRPGIFPRDSEFNSLMKTYLPFLALLILFLGPGPVQQVPLPADGEADAASLVTLEHRAESPARTLRPEEPQRSAIDPPAPPISAGRPAAPEALSSAQLGRPPLDLSSSPSLHLKLCVFLC